jgi:hypothetical protein
MPNTLRVIAIPELQNGKTMFSVTSTWGYSAWANIVKNIPNDVYIMGITFDLGYVGSADTAWQSLFEIGKGPLHNPTTIAQIPYSFRSDTAVGYWLDVQRVFFPEPILVSAGNALHCRVSSSIVASQILHKVKLILQSEKSIVSSPVSMNNYLFAHGSMSGGECIR